MTSKVDDMLAARAELDALDKEVAEIETRLAERKTRQF